MTTNTMPSSIILSMNMIGFSINKMRDKYLPPEDIEKFPCNNKRLALEYRDMKEYPNGTKRRQKKVPPKIANQSSWLPISHNRFTKCDFQSSLSDSSTEITDSTTGSPIDSEDDETMENDNIDVFFPLADPLYISPINIFHPYLSLVTMDNQPGSIIR